VAAQVLHSFGDGFVVCGSDGGAVVLLGRGLVRGVLCSRNVQIRRYASRHVAGQQCGSPLGYQALRQVLLSRISILCAFISCFSTIKPTDNMFVSYVTHGEGWHNYHHTFPWDYKAAELDSYNGNSNTAFIDLMAKIGLAYDLKTASAELVKKRVQKTKSESAFVEEKKFDKGDLVFVPSSIAASEVRFR
jgi:hypothetical protein